ncbi:MAG: hypothetical protein Q9218_008037, partial [Villophora microphyllina]
WRIPFFVMSATAVRTASIGDSIWKGLGEDAFRRNVVNLAKASEVPGSPRTYSSIDWSQRCPSRSHDSFSLAFDDEQRIADDLAYVAASQEDVRSVSAVALEEHPNPPGLTVRLAANASIPDQVVDHLRHILQFLRARVETRGVHLQHRRQGREELTSSQAFQNDLVFSPSSTQSSLFIGNHWNIPCHYRIKSNTKIPLHRSLSGLLSKIRKNPEYRQVSDLLALVCSNAKNVDKDFTDEAEEVRLLQKVIGFCSDLIAAASKNKGLSLLVASEDKHIKQVGKLGRYRDLCAFLAKLAARYPDLCKNMTLKVIKPYSPTRSTISVKEKTVDCYVHAEIQLITFYGMVLNLDERMPRVFGVSKSACYLCDMFIRLHRQFLVSKTHGQLYDQWTVPDLVEFSHEQRQRFRGIVQRMHESCKNKTSLGSAAVRRQWPLQSSHNLLDYSVLSPIASSTTTHRSSQATIKASTPEQGSHTTAADTRGPAQSSIKEPYDTVAIPVESVPDTSEKPQPRPVHDTAENLLSIHQSPDDVHGNPIPVEVEAEAAHRSVEEFINRSGDKALPSSSTPSPSTELSATALLPPLQRSITQDSPFAITAQGIHIHFESEDPTRCLVSVTVRPDNLRALGNAVNIDAIAPGEVVEFVRNDAAPITYIGIYRKNHQPTRIDLEWLQ